ncbi:hypothetical protein OROGR_027636 [Orobanche gracilis]
MALDLKTKTDHKAVCFISAKHEVLWGSGHRFLLRPIERVSLEWRYENMAAKNVR